MPIDHIRTVFIVGGVTYIIAGSILPCAVIALITRNTIKYFKNRSMIKVVDALRMGDINNKHVIRFSEKFRKKQPESKLTNDQVFSEVLDLDKKGSLCNGELTGSNSDKIRKLLSKNKHLFEHLESLWPKKQ